jgi:hypothetical protein
MERWHYNREMWSAATTLVGHVFQEGNLLFRLVRLLMVVVVS